MVLGMIVTATLLVCFIFSFIIVSAKIESDVEQNKRDEACFF